MSNTQKTAKIKPPYKGYTLKEKWLPSLLLSLFAPLTVCFFGPFEIYGNNMSEFKFLLWDFWLLCGAVALGIAVVIFGLLMLLRGRAYDVCFGLFFGLSLMLFVQGNYLSLGAGSLSGDGVGELLTIGKIVFNSIIWIIRRLRGRHAVADEKIQGSDPSRGNGCADRLDRYDRDLLCRHFHDDRRIYL